MNKVKLIAEALLTEWSNCLMADTHGNSFDCSSETCTFTKDLFYIVINLFYEKDS
jgi:hypothetical protein